MAFIIYRQLNNTYNTETKQVTAVSISNLRLIIQDHFLIMLVSSMLIPLTVCELGYFSPPDAISSLPVLSYSVAVSSGSDLPPTEVEAKTPLWCGGGCWTRLYSPSL